VATTRPTHLVRNAVALAAAGLVLAGCAAQPGAAATVNGTTISENDVDDATAEFVALTGQDTTPVVVLNTLVQAELLDPIATKAGYAVSDAQVQKFFLEQGALAGAEEPPNVDSPAFLDLGRFLMQYNEINSSQDAQKILTELGTALQDADVKVNPRYGQTNESGVIVPTAKEWIHQDEAPATPAG